MLLPAILLLALAACGGGAPTSGKGPTQEPNQLADFAQCMRDHGQNMPDPAPNGDSFTIAPPTGGPNAGWEAALQACRSRLPDGGVAQPPTEAELEALRRYAQCMRAHGIESTDPDPATGKSKVQGRLANATRDQLQNDPGYRAAQEACKDQLPKGQQQ